MKDAEKNSQPVILGKYHQSYVKLKPDDVLYIENTKHGSLIHVSENSMDYSFEENITTTLKLADLYPELKEYGFVYAHNSYIVNLKYVKKLHAKGLLRLSNGKELNVSRSRQKEFREAFCRWGDVLY